MKELDLNAKARRIERGHEAPAARAWRRSSTIIGDVRGRGAMIADRAGQGRARKEPTRQATAALAKACHAEGLLVLTCGTYGNVLRFLPPLVIGEDLLNEGLDVLEGALAGL